MEAQLAKLDRLDLSEEAIAALERDFQRMSRAQEIAAAGVGARGRALGGGGRDLPGWRPWCGRRAGSSRSTRASKALAERIAAVSAELGELASEFGSLGRELQADPEGRAPSRSA